MHKKKLLIASVASVLLSVLFVLPVSAHGHNGNHHYQSTAGAAVSQAETDTGSDTATGADVKTDTTADTNADTITQYPVCTVTGCTNQGIHTHDDTYYCGYDHESGYCDGTCSSSESCHTSRRTHIIRNRHHHH